MDAADHFAGRLKELRIERGWSQAELAERAGLPQQTISHLENGVQTPKWGNLLKIAGALGVSCQDFLTEPKQTQNLSPGRRPKGKD